MATFFSGTDTNTLKEEGRDRNHFVSLIVNNAGTYTAAVTRKVKSIKTIQESYSYGSFNDDSVANTREYQEETEHIEYFMLDITKEGESCSFQEIDKRLEEIRKRKATTPTTPSKIVTSTSVTYPRLKEEGKKDIPSLFTKRDLEGMESEPPRIIKPTNDYIPFTSHNISTEDVHHVLLQLLTGSIIIRDTSKIDIKKWVNSMPQVFGERFGVDENSLHEFKLWADSHCEFLIYDKEPHIETADEEANWASCFAMMLYEELDALPKNKYIEILKEIIEQWIA